MRFFSDCVFTFIFSSENKDSVTCHYLKLVVFSWSGHLDGSQWDHSFRVDVLEHEAQERKLRKPGLYKPQSRFINLTVWVLFYPLILYTRLICAAGIYTNCCCLQKKHRASWDSLTCTWTKSCSMTTGAVQNELGSLGRPWVLTWHIFTSAQSWIYKGVMIHLTFSNLTAWTQGGMSLSESINPSTILFLERSYIHIEALGC